MTTCATGYARNVRSQIELATGVLAHFHGLEQAGALDREAAQKAAKEALRGLRYQNNEYFFVLDLELNMLMHPLRPSLEGKLADLRDSAGKHFVREMVTLARAQGQGFVELHLAALRRRHRPGPAQDQLCEGLPGLGLGGRLGRIRGRHRHRLPGRGAALRRAWSRWCSRCSC